MAYNGQIKEVLLGDDGLYEIEDKYARDHLSTAEEDITNINESITNINGAIDDITDDISNLNDSSVVNMSANRYYVDGVNGSDDNDGLTEATAFKTLEKFLDLANKVKLDVRCYIISAGTYSTPAVASYASISIHITANVDGVILNFRTVDGRNFAFYQCHVNIQAAEGHTVTIKVNNGISRTNALYFDSGSFWFVNCIFTNNVYSYGSGGHFGYCTLVGLHGWYSGFRCDHVKFNYDGLSNNDDCFLFRMLNCNLYITGGDPNPTQINILSDGSKFALFRGCRLSFDRNFGSNGGTGQCTSGNWLFDQCVIPISQTRFNGLKDRCTNVNYGDDNIIGCNGTMTIGGVAYNMFVPVS